MQKIPNLFEQVFVNSLLAESNGKTSSLLDTFSGWLMGGFGASATLLVSKYDSIIKHLDAGTIRQFLVLFLWSLGVGIVAKYLAVGVASHSQASSVGRDMGEKASANSVQLDFEIIFREMERAILPPFRWFVKRSFQKAKNGDIISATRKITIILQVQGLLILTQAVLVMTAICKVAYAFHA